MNPCACCPLALLPTASTCRTPGSRRAGWSSCPAAGRRTSPTPPARADSPTIVLLHALGCTGLLTWFPAIEPLSRRFRVVTLDLRWHGQGIQSEEFSLPDCADDVAALIDVLELDDVIVAGYSMGSIVAQRVWRQHARQDRRAGAVRDHRPVPDEPRRAGLLHLAWGPRCSALRAHLPLPDGGPRARTAAARARPRARRHRRSGRSPSSAPPARGRSARRSPRSGGTTPGRGSAGSTCRPRSWSPARTT